MGRAVLTFHTVGDWPPGAVAARWAENSRPIIPEVEAVIDEAWAEAQRRPGVKLFDGPMCRLESWAASPARLELVLSRGSYKPFLGTNLSHPELADRFGPNALANPVGVSPALETSDGYLMLGRRNASVAYYPSRIHPFAGALEPRDGSDVFAAVRRELAEELSFREGDVADVRCTGLVEDASLRQPELIFRATSTRTRAEIEAQVHDAEHHASWSVSAVPDALARAIGDPLLTPVAVASIL